MPDYSGTTGGAGVLLWKTDKVTECKSDGMVIGNHVSLVTMVVCAGITMVIIIPPIAHFSLDKRPMLNS